MNEVACFYALGKAENQLLSYDEYSSESGVYFSDSLLMCNRYTYSQAEEELLHHYLHTKEILILYIIEISRIGENDFTPKIEIMNEFTKEDIEELIKRQSK
jgi:hypothetical protein